MNHEDEYGFWDDDRGNSLTGRRSRPLSTRRHHAQPANIGPHTDASLFWTRIGMISVVGAVAIAIALAASGESSPGQVAAVNVQDAPVSGTAPIGANSLDTSTPMTSSINLAVQTVAPVVAAARAATSAPIRVRAVAQVPTTSLHAAKPKTACAKSYTVVALDYWILISKKFGVSVKDLLAVNQAKTSTALYPGRTLCLPSNAVLQKVKTSPPTTPPTMTEKPSKTKRPEGASPPTTAKPTASKAKVIPATQPTTPDPAPLRSYSASEVEQIIRDVWPDELEDRAVAIATRESGLNPVARNSCCLGLFQIYWGANQRFLSTIGISSASMLYDPLNNANAAYAMYLRSGWGPWS